MTSSLVMDAVAAQATATDINPQDYIKTKRAQRAKVSPHAQALKSAITTGQTPNASTQASQEQIEAVLQELKDQFTGKSATPGVPMYNIPVSQATRRKLLKITMAKGMTTYGIDGVDGRPSQANSQGTATAHDAQSVRRANNQKAMATMVAQLNGKDVVETQPNTIDAYRLLGQSSRLTANSAGPQNTPEQLRNVATNPGPGGVQLPAPSAHIASGAEYTRLATKMNDGVAVKVASGAFGDFGDEHNFNWGAFFVYLADQQLKEAGKFLLKEKLLILLQGALAIDGDKVNVEFQKVNNEIGRLDALQALLGNQQPSEAMANESLKRLANAGSVLEQSELDLPNALTNQQHRGPVADQLMQNMLHKMALGKGQPILSENKGSAEAKQLVDAHNVPEGTHEPSAFDPEERLKWGDKELNDRVLCELYPGGPTVPRTVLTQDEIAGLSPSNQLRYKAARKKNLNVRANDWYGRAAQIQTERHVLLSAAKKARAEAERLERNGQADLAQAARRHANAFAQKAEYFLNKRDAKVAAATNDAELREAERYDPDIGKILSAVRRVERIIGGNEESTNKAHQQISYQSYVNRGLIDRLKHTPIDIEINRNSSLSAAQQAKKDEMDRNELAAQRGVLRQSAVNLAWRQIGLGDMRRRYLSQAPKNTFHSANLQDAYELAKARVRHYDTLYTERNLDDRSRAEQKARDTGRPAEECLSESDYTKEARVELRNARTYLKHFETLVPEREMGAVRLHSAMLNAHRHGENQAALLRARLVEALGGKSAPRTQAERDAISQGSTEEENLPKHERVPSVDELRTWMKNTPRERVVRHLKERAKFRENKHREYSAQYKEAVEDRARKQDDATPLRETIDRMSIEGKEHDKMVAFIDTLGTKETFAGGAWGKSTGSKLLTAFNLQGSSGKMSANQAMRKGVEEQGHMPIFATHDAKAGKDSLQSGNNHDEPNTDMFDSEDVDYTNLDDLAGNLQAKANAVNDVYGDLNLDNNTTGAYEDKTMKRLDAWDQNAQRIDFSNLAQQPSDDLYQSAQGIADMINGIRGEMVQALQESGQNASDMASRMLQTAHAIPHPS